jgi:hypothetical protein
MIGVEEQMFGFIPSLVQLDPTNLTLDFHTDVLNIFVHELSTAVLQDKSKVLI